MADRKFVAVERKSFIVEWRKKAPAIEAILLLEKTKGGIFRTTTTVEGGKWLGQLLFELSLMRTPYLTYKDHWVSMMGRLKQNRAGRYLELNILKKEKNQSEKPLIFPEGNNRNSWCDLGVSIIELLNHKGNEGSSLYNNATTNKNGQSWNMPKATQGQRKYAPNRSYSNAVRIGVSDNAIPYSWWKFLVVGKTNSSLVDWVWVKSKVEKLFGNVGLNVVKQDEVLITLASEEDAQRMEPLEEGGVRVFFKLWSPEIGCLSEKEINPPKFTLRIFGLPMHLRNDGVVQKVVASFVKLGNIQSVDLNFSNIYTEVVVSAVKREAIPRVVYMEEGGKNFVLKVEILEERETTNLKWQFEGFHNKPTRWGNEGCTVNRTVEAREGDGGDRVSDPVISNLSRVPETMPTQRATRTSISQPQNAPGNWKRAVEGLLNLGSPAHGENRGVSHSNRFQALQEEEHDSPVQRSMDIEVHGEFVDESSAQPRAALPSQTGSDLVRMENSLPATSSRSSHRLLSNLGW
ncbi:hypothetical protein FRX31_025274, partial [Thalictrum thalictroides]